MAQVQFGALGPAVDEIGITDAAINLNNNQGLISSFYTYYLNTFLGNATLRCKIEWKENLGDISGETWEEVLHHLPSVSLSTSHRIIQFLILQEHM